MAPSLLSDFSLLVLASWPFLGPQVSLFSCTVCFLCLLSSPELSGRCGPWKHPVAFCFRTNNFAENVQDTELLVFSPLLGLPRSWVLLSWSSNWFCLPRAAAGVLWRPPTPYIYRIIPTSFLIASGLVHRNSPVLLLFDLHLFTLPAYFCSSYFKQFAKVFFSPAHPPASAFNHKPCEMLVHHLHPSFLVTSI